MVEVPSLNWLMFTQQYYRWHLHSLQRSDQHNLLLDLESKGNLVVYTAPMFHESAELNSYFLHDGVLDNSAAFLPSDIGPLPDEKDHYMVFNRAGLVHRCSEDPVPAKFQTLSRFLQGQLNKPKPQSLEAGGVIKLGDQIVEAVKVAKSRRSQDSGSRPSEIDTEELSKVIRARPSLVTLSLISRTVLDSELLVINPQWQRTPKLSP